MTEFLLKVDPTTGLYIQIPIEDDEDQLYEEEIENEEDANVSDERRGSGEFNVSVGDEQEKAEKDKTSKRAKESKDTKSPKN